MERGEAAQTALQRYRVPIWIGGAVVLIWVLRTLFIGDDRSFEVPAGLGATSSTSTTSPVASGRPDVDPLDCGTLLTTEELDDALDVWNRPDGERSTLEFARGETCVAQLASDDAVFVRIEPGFPHDLEPDAKLLRVTGESVSGEWDDARWFGGEEAEGGGAQGLLSVGHGSSLGAVHFRVTVGRPELDGDEQREIATTLARAALPRFPGVELEVELRPYEIAEPEVDRSDESYLDNLLVKEEAGEWSRTEGLVATLQLFAGDAEAADVLRNGEVIDQRGTEIIRLAMEELEDPTDPDAADELERLLAPYLISAAELEALASSDDDPPDADAGPDDEGALGGSPQFVSVRSTPTSAQDGGTWCEWAFGPGAPSSCLRTVTNPDLDAKWPGKYALQRPVSEVSSGWTTVRVDAAIEAMSTTAELYEGIGEMPPVTLVLTGRSVPRSTITSDDDTCVILIHTLAQEYDEDYFQQYTASDMAACLIAATFPPSGRALLNERWWTQAFQVYLSELVYPDVNLEHAELPGRLELNELAVPLLERRATDWIFFDHLHRAMGVSGIFEVIHALPESIDAIIGPRWHAFNEEMSDAAVRDLGEEVPLVPFDPDAIGLGIAGPGVAEITARPLGMVRLEVTVDGGDVACATYESTGPVTASWRTGEPGRPGGEWGEPPDVLEATSVFLVTATRSGEVGLQTTPVFTITVDDVVDSPDDCEEDDEGSSTPTTGSCQIECGESGFYFTER